MNVNLTNADATRPRNGPSRLRAWLRLCLGLAVIWFCVFVLGPWLERIPTIGRMHDHIRENSIDATALYYTEVEEFAEAETHIRSAMQY